MTEMNRCSKLSILIPLHNAAATIQETLESINEVKEGWNHIDEIIICDDKSTDESLSIAKSFVFDHVKSRVVEHEGNRGEAETCNTLVNSMAEGVEWFLILHSDDIVTKAFISRNVDIIKLCDDKVASVSSNFYLIRKAGESLAGAESEHIYWNAGTPENLKHSAVTGCWWHISGALIRKKHWLNFGGMDKRYPYVGDWDLLLRWQQAGLTVGHSMVATTKYREWIHSSLSVAAYTTSKDLIHRTDVVASKPDIFYGYIKLKFTTLITVLAIRRSIKSILRGEIAASISSMRALRESVFKMYLNV